MVMRLFERGEEMMGVLYCHFDPTESGRRQLGEVPDFRGIVAAPPIPNPQICRRMENKAATEFIGGRGFNAE